MGFHLGPWGTVDPAYIPPCSLLIHAGSVAAMGTLDSDSWSPKHLAEAEK